MLCVPLFSWSQAAAPAAPAARTSPYTDPVFYALCAIAFVLLVFILQLQKVLSAVGQNYVKEKKNYLSTLLLLIAVFLFPENTFAQGSPAASEQDWFLHRGFGSNAMNALFFLIVFEIAVVIYYVRLIRLFTAPPAEEVVPAVRAEGKPAFWERFHQSVAIEKEAAILTDHDYDGIRELDNALPPWWKYGFYLTIVWAVVYMVYFHVTQSGPLSLGEYENQLAVAEEEMMAYRAKAANLVDETNVVLLTSAEAMGKGKMIFDNLCVTCHGSGGEGKVGPNLTDAYWKNGGDIKDLFKTIKYGVAGSGMKSWKSELSPSQMAEVSTFILSLQGTQPANGKEPEGNLYTPAPTMPLDSSATNKKTAAIAMYK
jgi:cytochrome c oxidase cbb3-type subunit 3